LVVPEARVTLQAAEDSAVLLTVSKTPGSSSLTRDRPRTDQEVLHAPTELRSRSARRKESAIGVSARVRAPPPRSHYVARHLGSPDSSLREPVR